MTKARSRTCRSALALLAVSGSLAAAQGGVSAAAAPVAHAARACPAPHYPGSGYFTSLRVTHASCDTGRKVARAHYNCRTKHGKSGHCHRAVAGFHCKEYRPASARIPTQYSSRVTCKRGSRKVVFVYQQNT